MRFFLSHGWEIRYLTVSFRILHLCGFPPIREEKGEWMGHRSWYMIEQSGVQASTFSPCFSTISNNFSAIPLGLFTPDSHFSTVDSLVFR